MAAATQEAEIGSPTTDEAPEPDLRSLDERLADRTEIGYKEFGELIDRKPQSLRSAMMRRRKHEREEGRARATDILQPAGERYAWPRTEPFWYYGDALEWAMQRGKIATDGRTPVAYRGSEKKRREYREAHGLPIGGRKAA